MKKAKIMLLAIAVIAVAGGILAFKTKTCCEVCTLATKNGICPLGQTCPTMPPVDVYAEANAAGNICFSILPDGENCEEQLCTIRGFTAIATSE